MNKDLEERIKAIAQSIREIEYVDDKSIPDIGLYMDQVIQFLDEHLSDSRRNEDDKIMTKTMINNYAKSGMIPSPEKKKYSKEHMMVLILLFYFKSFLPMSDIEKFLGPVIDEHFYDDRSDISFKEVFRGLFSTLHGYRESLDGSVDKAIEEASKAFGNAKDSEQDMLQLLTFISILSQDIISRLLLIERIIDTLPDKNPKDKSSKDRTKGKK